MILRSQIDKSVNIVTPIKAGGYFETRAVQRTQDTLIVYLSSMTGCDRACRFCHLTQTGQTQMTPATVSDYTNSAKELLALMAKDNRLEGIQTVHYNFMARGDILSNPHFTEDSLNLFAALTKVARKAIAKVKVKFKLSTIFPSDTYAPSDYQGARSDVARMILETSNLFNYNVEFYYSLYSLKPQFRKRWIPKSLDPEEVGKTFNGLDKGLRLHHALIAGENDTEEDVALIHEWLERHDLKVKLNLVRYNPYDQGSGEESDENSIKTYLTQMRLSHRILDTQIVTRVGTDVHASCGTFFE